jgi:hypothetical protein
MTALGDIEPVDLAIHADTTWERQSTYEFARTWSPWLEEHGVRVRVVTANDSHAESRVLNKFGGVSIPAYTSSPADNVRGQLRRQCTYDWKIAPMRRYLRQLGVKQADFLLGITLDEWRRAKDADVKWIKNIWPLLDRKMTRGDCITWLKDHSLPVPDKSSCTFCPYHNKKAWEAMKRAGGDDWKQAVEVDRFIRDKRPPYPLFVYSGRKPLENAVRIPEEDGYIQSSLWHVDDEDAQCDSGYCFL